MADLLSSLFWRFYATVYDTLWDNVLAATVARTVASLLPRESEVLEVGAGTGIMTGHLVREGIPMSACEPDPAMARRFRRRLPAVRLHHSGHDDVRFRGPQVAVNVVHLLPAPREAVRAMQRRGPVVIVTPEPWAGLRARARAQLVLGVRPFAVARFAAIHLLVGPLAALCGVARGAKPDWMGDEGTTIHGVYRLIVRPGEPESVIR
jgi:SAM-dependent methyltransferase